MIRPLFMALGLLAVPVIAAPAPNVELIDGPHCTPGVHHQPGGPFAVHVFCDDALGTNIAVLLAVLDSPLRSHWTLTKRFWQSEEWGADVVYLAWVPKGNQLVLSTSPIYGTGTVYLLNLETQTHSVLLKAPEDNECGASVASVNETSVTLGLAACVNLPPYKQLTVPFPQSNQPLHPTPNSSQGSLSGAGERRR